MVDNSRVFLEAFNRIENHLRVTSNSGPERSFAEVVRGSRLPIVQRLRTQLLDYAQLRNAIVHSPSQSLYAVPTAETAAEMSRMAAIVVDPPRLQRVVGIRQVVTSDPRSPVRDSIAKMREGDFSQVPIYGDGVFVGLLTAETVTRWLSWMLTTEGGIVDDVPVSSVPQHAEDDWNVAFLGPDATVMTALDAFESFRLEGRTLDAILVSQDGRRDARPLNIVTVYDVPTLMSVVMPPRQAET